MIPVLYNHAEKSFTSNGLGRLTDCTSCIVTEERNGVFECEFTYPISGRHYEEIAEGCIIFVTHDNSGIPQPFDIYKRSVPINGEVTFYAAHVSYRLGKIVLMPYTATSCANALSKIPANCLPECEFSFITDKSVNSPFRLQHPTAAKAILCGVEGSILDVYGTGEYKFNKFLVSLYLHRGTDTSVQIRYGKNLVDMTDELDSSGSYTAVVPFWTNPETGDVKMLSEKAVIADDAPLYFDYWTNEQGRRITDENNNEFEFAYTNITAVSLDLSSVFETEPTDGQMREKAQESANAHKLYSQSLSVDFVQLAQSEEYKDFAPLQELNLCDTCEVIYNNSPVRLKVIKTEYDALKDRYSKIELGDPPANYADVIMGEIADITPTRTQVTAAIKSASDLIKGVNGGNVVFRYRDGKPYEILIMDTDDVATAVNVLRINMNGIGFSHTGVDGEYVTAWTLDGRFVASFINSGTIAANNGMSSWDLDTGVIKNAYSTANNIWAEIKTGSYAIKAIIDGDEKLAFLLAPAVGNGAFLYNTLTMRDGLLVIQDGADMFTPLMAIKNDAIYFRPTQISANGTVTWRNRIAAGRFNSEAWPENPASRLFFQSESGAYFDTPDSSGFPSAAAGFFVVIKGSAFINTTLSAQTVTQRSDENLKNIWEYETAYDDVLDDLEPISYTWREDDDTSQHVGLGARQTRRILEEHGLYNAGLVVDRNDLYSINYAELSVMLLKRVQDQTKQIKDLSARLERLEALLADT